MKKFVQKNSNTMLLIVVIWMSAIIWLYNLPEQPEQQELEIQLIEVSDKGFYFLEPTAEFEPRIFVSNADVAKWELKELKVGASVVGLFDATGWELEGIKR